MFQYRPQYLSLRPNANGVLQMTNHTLFYWVIGILLLQFLIDTFLDYLNAKKYQDPIPADLQDIFNAEEYKKSQAYKKQNYAFGLLSDGFVLIATLCFLFFGGFEWLDTIARVTQTIAFYKPYYFLASFLAGSQMISLPFSYYQTFYIEEKFGFNKSTRKLFLLDLLKGWVLGIILGGGALAAVIWFLQWAGPNFWWYTWILLTVLMLFFNLFIANSLCHYSTNKSL